MNVVGRIESYARGGQVLISDSTYERVRDLVSVTGRFCMNAKGAEAAFPLHVVRGLGGRYRLDLPQSSEPMYAATPDVHATIARVVEERIGHDAACQLVAVGRESARVRTALMLAPLDDVVLRVGDDRAVWQGQRERCHRRRRLPAHVGVQRGRGRLAQPPDHRHDGR